MRFSLGARPATGQQSSYRSRSRDPRAHAAKKTPIPLAAPRQPVSQEKPTKRSRSCDGARAEQGRVRMLLGIPLPLMQLKTFLLGLQTAFLFDHRLFASMSSRTTVRHIAAPTDMQRYRTDPNWEPNWSRILATPFHQKGHSWDNTELAPIPLLEPVRSQTGLKRVLDVSMRDTIQQGSSNNCFVVASLEAANRAGCMRLEERVRYNPENQGFDVSLYPPGQQKPQTFAVSSKFPRIKFSGVYAEVGHLMAMVNPIVALVMKALIKYGDTYGRIGREELFHNTHPLTLGWRRVVTGGRSYEVLEALVGGPPTIFIPRRSSHQELITMLEHVQRKQGILVMGTNPKLANKHLVPLHAYTVTGLVQHEDPSKTRVRILNPWGPIQCAYKGVPKECLLFLEEFQEVMAYGYYSGVAQPDNKGIRA